jgi:serine/threonine protein kinase
MKNNKLKIADFGLARKIVSNTHYTQNRGTHGYQAP